MKKTKEKSALTRQAVLNAALSVFAKRGYAKTTLEEVAHEAGLTRGAIYWHFRDKFDMFCAVLQGCYERAGVRVTNILNSDRTPMEKIRHFMLELFRIITNEEELKVIEEVLVFKFEKMKALKKIYDDHLEKMKIMRGLLKNLIQQGIDAGQFKPNLDVDVTAMALISFVIGMKSAWLCGIGSVSICDNAQKLTDIFIYGIEKEAETVGTA